MPGMAGRTEFDVLVIGAGPAGLGAAIGSARGGLSVAVLEKNDQPGKKLLLTGGGRCNLLVPESAAASLAKAYGRSGRFLIQALHAFNMGDFLAGLGLELEPDADGTAHVRGGAKRVLEALLAEAARLQVEIITGAAVESARKTEGGGFEVETARGIFAATRRLVIATGGMTYPATGSSGDGYGLAESFGHAVEPPRPALGALATAPCFPKLAGLSVPDARAELRAGGKALASRRGPLLFTHGGLSGPAALDLSLEMARAGAGCGAELAVDFAPGLSREELVAALVARARAETKRTMENSGLAALPVPARLAVELARRAGLDPRRRMAAFSLREFGALADAVKLLVLAVQEPPAVEEAMVTVGGVATKELDPRTLESRLVPGLRFAGELLAPAGSCGGYNLLMAFATGAAAGR
jgi:hypothetical protein